jgi:acetyltransferase-like isoleucine patch superfamily enzyme
MKNYFKQIVSYPYLFFYLKFSDRMKEYFYINDDPKYSEYSIGDFSCGGEYGRVLKFDASATLKIGKFCSIGRDITIVTGGEHRTDLITTYEFRFPPFRHARTRLRSRTKGDVIIGNDVWIATGATILSGVKIGDGAVIGACSVVTKDVEPYSIVAGNPARLIRMRFDEETIDSLLKIKWWDWDIERIKLNMPLLLSENINEFIKKNRV